MIFEHNEWDFYQNKKRRYKIVQVGDGGWFKEELEEGV